MFTSRPNSQRHWLGVGLAFGIFIVYVVTFGQLYPALGGATNLLVIAVVALVGWFSGPREALLAGLLSFPLSIALLGAAENLDWATALRQGIAVGFLDPLLVAAVIAQLIAVAGRSKTALQQQDQAARDTEEKLRLITEQPIMGLMLIQDNVVKYGNQALANITGYSIAELTGWSPTEYRKLIHPEDKPFVVEQGTRKQLGEPDVVRHYTYRVISRSQEVRWVEQYSRTVSYQDRPANLVSVIDITNRMKAEQALRESEERYRVISDATFDALILHENSVVIQANQATKAIFGYEPQELVGRYSIDLLVSADSTQTIQHNIQTGFEGSYTATLTRKDGTTFTSEICARNVVYQGRRVRVASVRDVTERVNAEQALRQSEANLRAILDNSDNAYVLMDANMRVKTVNQVSKMGSRLLFGRDIEPGDAFTEFLSDANRSAFLNNFAQALRGERPSSQQDFVTPEGHKRSFEFRYFPAISSDGTILGVVQRSSDITERKQAEDRLRESEERFRLLVENSPSGIYMSAGLPTLTYANQRLADMMGCTIAELLATPFPQFIAEEDVARMLDYFVRRRRGDSAPNEMEFTAVRKDGQRRLLELHITQGPSGDGTINAWGQILDITERKQAEEALRASEQRYRTLFEQAPDGIVLVNTKGFIIDANMRSLEMFGYAKEDLSGLHMNHLVQESEVERVASDFATVVAGRSYQQEWQVKRKDGSMFASEIIASLMPDGNVLGIVRDISGRKQAEEAVRASELRYRALFEHAPDGILVLDNQGILLDANPHALQVFGYSKDETVGSGMMKFIADGDLSEINAEFSHLLAGKQFNEEWHGRRKDGSVFPGEVMATLMPDGHVLSIFRDITERKKAEEALHKAYDELEHRVRERTAALFEANASLQSAKERVEAILNNTADAILLVHPDFGIQQTNVAFNRLFNCETDAYVRQPLIALLTAENSNSIAEAIQAGVEEGQGVTVEARARRLDGSEFNAELSIGIINQEGLVCAIRDITHRKMAETALRQALEKEKELSELKSRFVSMASHEFRTPLATILALTETLAAYRQKMADAEIKDQLDKIREHVGYLNNIMEDVLLLARLQARRAVFNPTNINPDPLVRSVLDEFRSRPDIAHELIYCCDTPLMELKLDRKLMRQIVSNLVSNAVKYSSPSEPVEVTLEYTQDSLVLRVKDRGIGILQADLPYLFEPFHRASNVGTISGTGLGLVITKESVELHGGTIMVESQVGVGTTFVVILPGGRPHDQDPGDRR